MHTADKPRRQNNLPLLVISFNPTFPLISKNATNQLTTGQLPPKSIFAVAGFNKYQQIHCKMEDSTTPNPPGSEPPPPQNSKRTKKLATSEEEEILEEQLDLSLPEPFLLSPFSRPSSGRIEGLKERQHLTRKNINELEVGGQGGRDTDFN
eukprot:scaffold27324_cov63-Cyclotella_meneghiniana.AAC.3